MSWKFEATQIFITLGQAFSALYHNHLPLTILLRNLFPGARPQPRRSWKRLAAWIGAGAGLLVVVVVVGMVALLHSVRFHAYL